MFRKNKEGSSHQVIFKVCKQKSSHKRIKKANKNGKVYPNVLKYHLYWEKITREKVYENNLFHD